MAKAKKQPKKELYAIITNDRYGLYAGIVISHDVKTRVVVAKEVRHIAQWRGRTGGITSLAAHGICGPRAGEALIGAPVNATLTGIVNVFECSPAARATIEAVTQS